MKILKLVAGGIASVGAVQPAFATPEQFDLACSGERSRFFAGRPTETAAWTRRFQIDLSANMFCEEGCNAPETIHEARPGTLQLRAERRDGSFDDIFRFLDQLMTP